MKSVYRAYSIVTIIGLLFLHSGCKTKNGYPIFPISYAPENIVDSWIGFSDQNESSYKLVLDRNGSGMLYSQFQNETIIANRIERWRIREDALLCEIQHDSSPFSPSSLTCEIKKDLLAGKLSNGTGGWTENVLFRRNRSVEKSLSKFNEIPPE